MRLGALPGCARDALAWFRRAHRPSLWGDDQQRQQDAVEGTECALGSSQPELTAAYAATVVALTQIIAAFNQQIPALEAQVGMSFRRHPAARIPLNQPQLGPQLAARVLGEFGDAPHRYATAKGRKKLCLHQSHPGIGQPACAGRAGVGVVPLAW
jgi:transposase